MPADYFPISMDIHSHILPGIDDGSPDIETSLQLIAGLYAAGIRKSIATPHIIGDLYRNNAETINGALDKVQKACRDSGIDMEISAAAEYMLDDYFMQLLREKVPLLALHKNLVLTEFSYSVEPHNVEEIVFNLLTEGYQPILAHPERYAYLHRNHDIYFKLKDLGFHLQVNLLSLTGHYGPAVTKAAQFIVKNNLAKLVATDLHHERHLAALCDRDSQKIFYEYLSDSEWNDLDALAG